MCELQRTGIWERGFGVIGIGWMLAALVGCKLLPSSDSDRVLFPASNVPNYQQLVSVHWLKSLLDYQPSGNREKRPVTYQSDHLVVLEVSWASLENASDYRAGHVPGAIHLNTDDLENGSPRWRLRNVDELQQVIGSKGITPKSTVIVYGNQLIAAARVWWVLKYAGVEDVRLLDGGFGAWRAAGYPVEKWIQSPKGVRFEASERADWIASSEYVARNLENGNVKLGDVRSKSEYLGEKSGYSYINAKGRIPGAVHLGDADDQALLYSQGNGFIRPPSEVAALWRHSGVLSPEGDLQETELVLYCGGGWRSSLAFFYASLLGFENVRNYSDGWSGWSTVYREDPEAKGGTPGWRQEPTGNPVEIGGADRHALDLRR